MTSHQVSVAAEAYAASVLAQAGYDVLVQYGANQPDYDLVAVASGCIGKISVKGSSDGGWALAISHKKKGANISYHMALESWRKRQKNDVAFVFVQYRNVKLGEAPRVYVAKVDELYEHMRSQRDGNGHLALFEDYQRDHPMSRFQDRIPTNWTFSSERLKEVMSTRVDLDEEAPGAVEIRVRKATS